MSADHVCREQTAAVITAFVMLLTTVLAVTITNASVAGTAEPATGWASISSGSSHSCGLDDDGVAWCWGLSYLGVEIGSRVPVRVDGPELGGWRSISAGGDHTCGVAEDGSGWCWGINSDGELGDGTTGTAFEPVKVSDTDVTNWEAVSAGGSHSCGVAGDGSGWCWGSNADGRLGDGTTDDSLVPVRIDGADVDGWRSISVSGRHSCGVAEDGSGWCWGLNSYGQLGDGTTDDSLVPVRIDVGGVQQWREFSTGAFHSCGVAEDGSGWCWGSNGNGQLGDGTTDDSLIPVHIDAADVASWRTIAAGSFFTCGIADDDTAWCWGRNAYGQLGNGSSLNNSSVPVQVNDVGGRGWRSIDAGVEYACGVTDDATAWCWGQNSNGVLGDGSSQNSSIPLRVSPVRQLITISGLHLEMDIGETADISATADSGLTVSAVVDGPCVMESGEGTLVLSAMDHGKCTITASQTGDGFYAPAEVSAVVIVGDGPTLDGWDHVSAGTLHTCGVTNEGTAWCWGDNSFDQLGDGTGSDSSTPVPVATADRWKSVSAGAAHSCGVADDATLWCWGLNSSGQLGDGTTADAPVPVQVDVGGVDAWRSVVAGAYHSCGVAEDGSGWCWGSNNEGQLGDGTTAESLLPVQVDIGDVHQWLEISAGTFHSCGVAEDGSGWCWGSNNEGQLGDGTTAESLLPVQVDAAGSQVWKAMVAGLDHTCGVAGDDAGWCWGSNFVGQLGDGTGDDSSAPVRIDTGDVHGWRSLTSGGSTVCGVSHLTEAWCWGSDSDGQFGGGTTVDSPVPTRVDAAGVQGWSMLSSGAFHTCGVADDGVAWCWGANQSGQLGDHGSEDRSGPVRVSALGQSVSLSGVPAQMRVGDTVVVDGTADSGLAVSLAADGSCGIHEDDGQQMLSATGVGECTITASQPGNGAYGPAEDVSATVMIDRGTASVTISGTSAVYDGSPHAVSVVTDPEDLEVVVTYDGDTDAPVEAGSYEVEATVDDPNHEGSAAATLVIARADQQITLGGVPSSMVHGDTAELSASADSGSDVALAVDGACELDGDVLSATGVGACTVTASQGGGDNWNAADDVVVSVSVTAAPASVTITGTDATYDGTPHAVIVETDPEDLGVLVTYDGLAAPPIDAGSYEVEVTVDDPNHEGAASATLTIDRADTTVESTAPERVDVGQGVEVVVEVLTGAADVPGGTVTVTDPDDADVSATGELGADGTATIEVDGLGVGAHELEIAYGGDDNHAASTATVTVEVTTAEPGLVGVPAEAEPGETFEVTATGFEPGETVLFTLHSDPVELGEAVADAFGTAVATVTVPDEPGDHTLVATGQASDTTVQAGIRIIAEAVAEDPTPTVTTTPPEPAPQPAAPAPTATTDSGEQLPATGADIGGLLAVGALLAALGVIAVVATRRRRRPTT